MFIYVIVCSETLKIYVGQHKKEDLQHYLHQKWYRAHHSPERERRSYLYRAMRKHPRESWSIHPLVSGIEDKKELDEMERLLIYALNAQHPDVGYNICDGGEGNTSPCSEATKEKLRLAHTGRVKSAEELVHLSEAMKKLYAESPEYRAQLSRQGTHPTDESLKKMSDSHLGQSRPQTEMHKQRIGEANAKTWTPERRAAQAEQMKKNFRK